MTDKDELERIREKKMRELQEKQESNEARKDNEVNTEKQQIEAVLKQYLDDDARQRLNAIEMTKPEFAMKVKKQLAALAQSGRIQQKITGEQMKEILQEMKDDDDGFDIKRR